MGMFSSISNNAMQAMNNSQAVAGRPNVGIGRPYTPPDNWLGPAPITDMPPEMPPQMQPQQQPPVPGFQTSWQMAGYNSLEAMKDAMDPNWRNSPGQPGFGPAPMPEQTPQQQFQQALPMMMLPGAGIAAAIPQINQLLQQAPNLPTGSSPGGKSAMPGDNFSPGSNYRQAPGMPPNVQIGSPGGMMPEQFTGGLRPAPSNFRPPNRSPLIRSGGIMRRRMPR